MDREFIARNHIVERYIGGRMPISGALDFERFCQQHPELIDEIGLTDRISAAVRLLDASGRAPPWEERAKRWWERLPVLIGTVVIALGLAVTCVVLQRRVEARERSISSLQQRAVTQPLDPASLQGPTVGANSRAASAGKGKNANAFSAANTPGIHSDPRRKRSSGLLMNPAPPSPRPTALSNGGACRNYGRVANA